MTARRRWRAGLVLALLLLAAGVTAGIGVPLVGIVERVSEEQRGSILAERMASFERSIAGEGERLAGRLARIAEVVTRDAAGMPPGGRSNPVERLGPLVGLDLLVLVDGSGTIVSSLHWPQRAGLVDRPLLSIGRETAELRRMTHPDGDRPALVLRRPLARPGEELHLVGGVWIDGALIERLGVVAPWLLLHEEAPGPGSWSASPVGPEGQAWKERLASAASVSDPNILSGSGSSWTIATRVLHDAAGRELAILSLAADRAASTRLAERLRRLILIVGGLSALFAGAVGWWIAGRIGRPVDRLIHAVDAIAAGEADYTFPRTNRDELEQLEQSFSRLRRSLDVQQKRSAAAERVAAWREVARHVAHEVKNPLAPIRLTVENLQRARRERPEAFDEMFREGTLTILEEVQQLTRLVGEFSEFARLPPPQRRQLELHGLLDDVLALYTAGGALEVERDYRARPCRIHADPEQIARVIKNIVANALEALEQGGATGSNERRLEVRTEVDDGMVSIEIADNGPGISERAEGMVFEPYFTTKRRGTGLGMAIVDRIVTEHGGLIQAGNRPCGGARIVLRLPLEGKA